jgi:hypothetical protein
MMFNVSQRPTFTHDVPVLVPVNGGHEEQKLKTTFFYLDIDQIETFDLKTMEGTTNFLLAIVSSFHDLESDDQVAIPYTVEVRDQLFRRQYIRQALATYYFDAVAKVKEGN